MTAIAERAPKLRRTRKVANIAVWSLLCLVIAVVGIFAVYVRTGNAQVAPVLSGSMEPALMTGDVAVTHKVPVDSLEVGDIVVFHPPGDTAADTPKVHRIISLRHVSTNKVEFTTKGDANNVADPWGTVTMSGTAFKVVFGVPKVGWLINYGIRWIVLGILILLAGLVVRWTVHYLRSSDSEPETGGNTS